jgi:hypothetical protein
MTRLAPWTIAGILLAITIGTIHAWAQTLLERKHYGLAPRDHA